jgi:calcineurin-like phosphoesterase family protein
MTVFYTADLHFGHARIIEYCARPWSDAAAMNAGLVARWNAVVRPEDTVWVLGDVALSPKKLGPVAALNGHKILVAGNHDDCWTGHRDGRRARASLATYHAAGFERVVAEGRLHGHRLANGTTVTLAHLPYAGDHTETDRYARQRPRDDGRPLLCGHVHDAWRVSASVDGRATQVNVGVDVWDYTPVAESTIIETLAAAP